MNVGSLFSGIGGFDLGLERAGMRVVWQCESVPFRRAVLRKHWPDVPCFEDVRTLGADAAEPVDLICGGFPCTDLSLAGKGAGLDGEQSGLWTEMLRGVREFRPRYVVVENVAALLARGLGRVLGDLAASGYDAEWDCLPASAFGAPHRRDRVWLIAYAQPDELRLQPAEVAGGGGTAVARDDGSEESLADTECCRRSRWADGAQGRQPGADGGADRVSNAQETVWGQGGGQLADGRDDGWPGPLADATGERGPAEVIGQEGERAIAERPASGAAGSGWWATEPDVGRVAHGVPARVDRLAALGDALVPQIAEWIGRRILEAEEGRLAA